MRDDRKEYEIEMLWKIERYKNSLSRGELLEMADQAVRQLEVGEHEQLVLTEVMLLEHVDKIIWERLSLPSFEEWQDIERKPAHDSPGSQVIESSGLIDPAGKAIIPGTSAFDKVSASVTQISDELIARLAANPETLHQLSPRKFEELVAELLARGGYDVQLTPVVRDGGRDILALYRTDLGTFLYIVECKRYAAGKPVGVRSVRELYGVLKHGAASAAAMVTTSSYTRDALRFQRAIPYEMALHDFISLRSWLERSVRKEST